MKNKKITPKPNINHSNFSFFQGSAGFPHGLKENKKKKEKKTFHRQN